MLQVPPAFKALDTEVVKTRLPVDASLPVSKVRERRVVQEHKFGTAAVIRGEVSRRGAEGGVREEELPLLNSPFGAWHAHT